MRFVDFCMGRFIYLVWKFDNSTLDLLYDNNFLNVRRLINSTGLKRSNGDFIWRFAVSSTELVSIGDLVQRFADFSTDLFTIGELV